MNFIRNGLGWIFKIFNRCFFVLQTKYGLIFRGDIIMSDFKEVKPGTNLFINIYLNIMLWFVGRGVQAASRTDREVQEEFRRFPDNFVFSLGAYPDGPCMVVGKDQKGRVKYLGRKIIGRKIDLELVVKHPDLLFLLFSFQESTPVSNARDRLFVNGEVPYACGVVRILDIVQVYLLPGFIAKKAIKRYPEWSFARHTWRRFIINLRTVTGF